jgi:hypothetical protein
MMLQQMIQQTQQNRVCTKKTIQALYVQARKERVAKERGKRARQLLYETSPFYSAKI